MNFQLIPTSSLDFQVALNLGETARFKSSILASIAGNIYQVISAES